MLSQSSSAAFPSTDLWATALEPDARHPPGPAVLPRLHLIGSPAAAGPQSAGADAVSALLDLAGPVAGLHILVISRRALQVMCRPDAHGALSVTTIQAGRCMPTAPADLAIAPELDCIKSADMAILQARLSLRPSGRLLLHFGPDHADIARHAETRLRDNGFAPTCHQAGAHAVIAARLQASEAGRQP